MTDQFGRQRDRRSAMPAGKGRHTRFPEVFGTASRTRNGAVLELPEQALPFALGDALCGLPQAKGERTCEQVAQPLGAGLPEATRAGVVGVVGKLIAAVLWIKDKDGSFTIYRSSGLLL